MLEKPQLITHTHTLTHTLRHTLSHTHTHTQTHSLSHTHTHTHTHTLTHTLTHSLSLTHTHTDTLSLTHTHTPTLSQTHTHTCVSAAPVNLPRSIRVCSLCPPARVGVACTAGSWSPERSALSAPRCSCEPMRRAAQSHVTPAVSCVRYVNNTGSRSQRLTLMAGCVFVVSLLFSPGMLPADRPSHL